MARGKRASPSPISIGNCTVELEGNQFEICESSGKSLHISSPDGSKIKISVDDSRKYTTRKSYHSLLASLKSHDGEGGHEFLLVNAKDVDSRTKCLLQEILKIYMEELPTMNYAANTGKESLFLERCISSGKYRTLILRSNSTQGLGEVIAAVSYQIIPSDTQYAEIPLAAVSSKYQNKGIGCLLYEELRERLQRVGILTIFCWADKKSDGFWLKQGFISIGEVDCKGRTRRLPIKADIRRALCFPGGSTLMVAHLNKDTVASVNSSKHFSLCSSKSHAKAPGNVRTRTALSENRTNDTLKNSSPNEHIINTSSRQIGNTQTGQSLENKRSTDGASPCAIRLSYCANLVHSNNPDYSNREGNLEVIEHEYDTNTKHCSYSGQSVRKQVWEASFSSLKSKRVRGDHVINRCQDTKQDFARDHVIGNDSAFDDYSLGTSGCKRSLNVMQKDPVGLTSGIHSEENSSGCVGDGMISKGNGPKVMLMDIADDAKKTWLTKIVEELGGYVTSHGSACTHVITRKTRRTSNFCIALCSGAWIVSPTWLKASFREGKFLGESHFLLDDEEYRLKYKFDLRDAVMRVKEDPHSLLRGYDVCLAKHIQPSVDILSAIVKSAGGNVILRLGSRQEASRTIFVACEEDMEEALVAGRDGAWTFSSDWLMGCVMKQELDFDAPQFAESL